MEWFKLFRKKEAQAAPAPADEEGGLEIYSGMRVEVTDPAGQMLFVAKLMSLHGTEAELHQYSRGEVQAPEEGEGKPVRIRGYHDRERKAVSMEGVITPLPEDKWKVTSLKVCNRGNDRAFYRLETDLAASATMFSGLAMGEKPCRLLNISIGGARIQSEQKYYEGDKFMLKVRLLEDRPESIMFSQVVRAIEKDDGGYEYGCRFLELTEADQEQISKNIFVAQRQKRSGS